MGKRTFIQIRGLMVWKGCKSISDVREFTDFEYDE